MGEIEVIKRKGGTIQLFSRDPFCTIKSATQNISLMGDDNIQLSIISTELLDFEKGDKIIVGGEEYTIRTRVAREMKTDRYYQYDAVFYGVMYELMKAQYRNTDESGKSTSMTFDLTYSIRDFVKVIIYNMNRDYPGLWAFDEANCPDTEPRTISFHGRTAYRCCNRYVARIISNWSSALPKITECVLSISENSAQRLFHQAEVITLSGVRVAVCLPSKIKRWMIKPLLPVFGWRAALPTYGATTGTIQNACNCLTQNV